MTAADPVACFAATYAEAREKFLAAAKARGARIEHHVHPVARGAQGEALAIDVAVLGDRQWREVLLFTSGTHGAEGFCGSGCEVGLLRDDDFLQRAAAAQVRVVFLHALNPYGFSHLRRTNEDNVDLNRNFRDWTTVPPANEAYAEVHGFIVPDTWPPSPDNEARVASYLAARGERALQEAVTGGQCEHPDGLFYGGTRPAWSNHVLRRVLREEAAGARALAWIDFHTALGPRGHGEMIYNGGRTPADIARTKAWWGSAVTSFHDGTSTSAPLTGINGTAAADECPGVAYGGIALEYGTLPVLAVMQALRADQWLENHPDAPAAMSDGVPLPSRPGVAMRVRALWDGDVAWSFRHSPVAIGSLAVFAACVLCAAFAPWVTPHNPFDLTTLSLSDARLPPMWSDGGKPSFPLGTDDQGRDILSAIVFGARISLLVGLASVAFALVLGVGLGLAAGYLGGKTDAFIMRVADVQLSFPAILIALLIDGVARVALPRDLHDRLALFVLVFAIGLSNWVQYARTVRGSTMVEKSKEYVQAARVIGIPPIGIMGRHLLPNVMGPVLVLATINIATAILTEATLSFLGVGLPPTQPSLGTLIRIGNEFLFSGEWWITIFPGVALVIMVLSINLLGDWLRDALNPKLR